MRQYGEYATVTVLGLGQRELGEHMPDVCFDRTFAEEEPPRDPAVRESFGHQLEHMPFTLGQRRQRIAVPTPRDQTGHDLRIQRRPRVTWLGRRKVWRPREDEPLPRWIEDFRQFRPGVTPALVGSEHA
jgi:hypothetical protein